MPHHDAVVLAGGAILPCLCDAELLRSFDRANSPLCVGVRAHVLNVCLIDGRRAFVHST